MAIRILVVDDASFIRDMVKKHLRDRIPGVEVYDAVDGNRALAAMKNQAMDLILSDWEMPNMSGEELLRAVRANPLSATTPFVMVSSRGDRNHVIKAVEAGVSDYLSKPFTPDELLRKVFKQLKLIGKEPTHGPRSAGTQGIAFASVDVLTGGRSVEPAAAPASANASSSVLLGASAPKPKPATKSATAKARAQLRFANGVIFPCVVRELSLQALSGLIQRNEQLPRLFDPAAVDIELGDGGELARVNGYVHSVQAGESRAETQVVKIVIRFVDNDAEKFAVLSHFIAQT
jgi:DNA-binding response OmpR family regulator